MGKGRKGVASVAHMVWVLLVGCLGQTHYSKGDLYELGKGDDPKLEIIVADKVGEGPHCRDYGQGCRGAFMVKHRGLTFICVQYEGPKEALRFARFIDAYVVRNWLLDDVAGEPVLEEFVERAFKARRPGLSRKEAALRGQI
ncbi:MAG: hypothetical protein OXB88_05305 [Bacteriovoracales bacterium]|nr:hypothetical protein [Bacteriovoracales bacterium]